jgi:tRNA-Thr(GGU) m(6)t(6)A37 methyltransferase TsaA
MRPSPIVAPGREDFQRKLENARRPRGNCMTTFLLKPIGVIRSEIKNTAEAPLFYDEGAPNAFLELDPAFAGGLLRMRPGDEIIVLTWLHLAKTDVLQVHPRGDTANPLTGVFSTRSPARPNPIGLHRTKVLAIDGMRLHVGPIEAIDGTPVIDIKSVVCSSDH